MKSALILSLHSLSLSALVLLSACSDGAGSKDPSGYSTAIEMSVVQDLSVAERGIATRICYAYRSKSTSFRGQNYSSGTFIYNINSRNCVDARTQYNVNSFLRASTTAMVMVPDTDKPFMETIQTEQSGYLSQLCEKIQTNRPISNTVSELSTKVQINFFRDTADNRDGYTLKYFNPSISHNNALRIDSMETYKVQTQASVGQGQIQGMDESYSLYQTCGESDKFSEFIQVFSSFSK